MKFGTAEYDLFQKKEPYDIVSFKKKGNKSGKMNSQFKNKTKFEKEMREKTIHPPDPSVLPSCVIPLQTASQSYDSSIDQIRKQLDATQVSVFY